MKTVPLTQARYNLRDLTHRAQAGEVFVLTDRGKEVAALNSTLLIHQKNKTRVDVVAIANKIRQESARRGKKTKIEKTSLEMIRELRESSSRL